MRRELDDRGSLSSAVEATEPLAPCEAVSVCSAVDTGVFREEDGLAFGVKDPLFKDPDWDADGGAGFPSKTNFDVNDELGDPKPPKLHRGAVEPVLDDPKPLKLNLGAVAPVLDDPKPPEPVWDPNKPPLDDPRPPEPDWDPNKPPLDDPKLPKPDWRPNESPLDGSRPANKPLLGDPKLSEQGCGPTEFLLDVPSDTLTSALCSGFVGFSSRASFNSPFIGVAIL